MELAHVNGVDLCLETFGDPADPPILLIGGAAASMDWWDDAFCQRLASGLRFVVRYDLRDTGQSTTSPAGAPNYGQPDLVRDAVGLLDHLRLRTAHLVGISMGGGIAQRVGVDYPDRVASLTLISTSPGGPGGPDNPDLPPIAASLEERFASAAAEPDWSDREAVIQHLLDGERAMAGSVSVDEARLRQLAARVVDRSTDIAASMTNHYIIDDGEAVRPRLGEIAAPTLIVHGTEDPLLPYGHAEALAREIPGAQLMPVPGVGHQMPPPQVWDAVIPAILKHTSGGWDEQGDRLAAHALAAGDPTGWFERLYSAGAADEVPMPWDRRQPHWTLVQWADARQLNGVGRRAVVVGCGLGADAAYLANRGFGTVAFDLSETAVRTARRRFPDSSAAYVQADLLHLPQEWISAFDLVVEIYTVQALPVELRAQATRNVGRLAAPGGTLLVVAAIQDDADPRPEGPPWPLTRAEVEDFATDDLVIDRVQDISDPRQPTEPRWRAEFHRLGAVQTG
jgi:pimeloyl-ACP methyl ester carboxylesterase/SAM-dependent methyltransferase